MKFKGLYTAVSALSLIAAPTLAAAAPIATPLTQPATETVDGDNELAGAGIGIFILVAAVGAIALGVTVASTQNDSTPDTTPNTPNSP